MLVFTLVSLVIESDILGVIIVRLFFSVIHLSSSFCYWSIATHCFVVLSCEKLEGVE